MFAYTLFCNKYILEVYVCVPSLDAGTKDSSVLGDADKSFPKPPRALRETHWSMLSGAGKHCIYFHVGVAILPRPLYLSLLLH